LKITNIKLLRKLVLWISMALLAIKLFAIGAWTEKAAMTGGGRDAAVSFTLSGKAYVLGGVKSGTEYKDLWMFDPVANTWTQKTSIPGASSRVEPIAFVINNIAYVGLGFSSGTQLATMYKYDGATDVWTAVADFPENRRAARACSVDSLGYVFGGFSSGNQPTRNFYAYNSNTNKWVTKASLPASASLRSYPVMAALNGKVYMMGGYVPGGVYLKDFWEYDTKSNVWTQLNDFPGSARTTASTFVLEGFLYIGQGKDASAHFTDWHVYNFKTSQWTTICDFPENTTYGNAFFSIGKMGYVAVGQNSGTTYSDRTYEFKAVLTSSEVFKNEDFEIVNLNNSSMLKINTKQTFKGRLVVQNTVGQLIEDKDVCLQKGDNYITIEAKSTGIFVVTWLNGDSMKSIKILVL